MKRIATYIILLLLISCNDNEIKQQIAFMRDAPVEYDVVFSFDWNSSNFPIDYPPNPHFSPIVGWSHKATTKFMKLGTLATTGIEFMAETGTTTAIMQEINRKIATGEGYALHRGSGLTGGVGEIRITIQVTKNNPAVSLVSMIAPSPDWYVGVVNQSLLSNGQFVNSKTVTALLYDAGTDNGTTFRSADIDADPHEPISLISDPPLGDGSGVNHLFATVTFNKVE